jgi:hypothetical protein
MRLFNNPNSTAGKMTVSIIIFGFAIFAIAFLFNIENERAEYIALAQSDYATTSVTVLNTPPQWTVDAQESPESSTSSPTNATSTVSWSGTGTDSNAEDYFLIICKTSAIPDAQEDAPPICDGGDANQWAISATTTSGVAATAATTTEESWAELNDWWASICDISSGPPGSARCNTAQQQGSGSTISPFHVNHRPTFTAYINDGPADPGAQITFYSTSSDPDNLSSDQVRIFICETTDFDFVAPGCGGGAANTIATSSFFAADAATTTTIAIPKQDDVYQAYAWVLDTHDFAALEVGGPTTSPYTVSNVAPTVSSASISLNYGQSIVLTAEEGETTGFEVKFTVTDNNSCVANASTTSEFNAAFVSVFRGGLGVTGCDEVSEFDVNNCYNSGTSTESWAYTDATATSTDSCTGPNDVSQDYVFTFPLWYVADPTDGASAVDSIYWSEEWFAGVQVSDDNLASSTYATSSSGVELLSLSAFDLNTTAIPYGSIEPGNTTTPIVAATVIEATGNIGIDQLLDGEDMCTDYTVFDSCYDPSPATATSTIFVEQQVYGTSSVAYSDAKNTQLLAAATELELNVPKSTVTSTPATASIYWGIAIPNTIQLSGSYTGQNTFTVQPGEATDW